MNQEIFSVYDNAVKRFMEPFDAPSVEYAIRSFVKSVNHPGHPFNEYPESYVLFHVGSFDQEKGVLIPCVPENLGLASNFKTQSVFDGDVDGQNQEVNGARSG